MADPSQVIQALCSRLDAVRWLKPDAEMDTLAEASLRWIDERVDEHRSALAPRLHTGPSPHLTVTITRSLPEARRLSGHARFRSELTDFSNEALAWVDALEQLQRIATIAAIRTVGMEAVTEAQEAVWTCLRTAVQKLAPPPQDTFGFPSEIALGAAGGEALVAHATMLLGGEVHGATGSPWTPLLALWERGLCPLAAPDGGVIVYAPVWRDDKLVPEPSKTADKNNPWEVMFSGGIQPQGRMIPSPEGTEGNGRQTLKRFNRMGLGPLLGMYVPPNMLFSGVTNWPGPQDLFIVRPLERAAIAQGLAAIMATVPGLRPSFESTTNLPGPPFPDPPDSKGVPWYRKIFKRGTE